MINIIQTHNYIISHIEIEAQINQCLNKQILLGRFIEYGSGNLYQYNGYTEWLTFRTIIQKSAIENIEI
jgi:hypothetical protein